VLGAGVAAAMIVPPAEAQEEIERHGISAFGDLKYPADFKQFDYVNPNAPKGGVFSFVGSTRAFNQNFLTFNSLNTFILKGDAAQGMEMTFATMMAGSGDEPDSLYGLVARAVRVSADGLTYRFLLRTEARFHDGSRLTAHDVVFSLNTLKEKGHPVIVQLMRDVVGVEASDDATVLVRFAPKRGRDVPLFVGGLPIFSRAYYANRNFDETTLEAPLGSGAYKVGKLEVGRFIEYDRVQSWWGANLSTLSATSSIATAMSPSRALRERIICSVRNSRRGCGRRATTSRLSRTAASSATCCDDTPSGAQGWFMNTRRDKFKDPRVREALINAFDFEWTNKSIMYGSYERVHSVYQNSDLMAKGKPSAEELALLEPFRGRVPDEVFGEPFVPPVSDGSGQDRALLRKAIALLQEAGYVIKDGKRVSPKGERFTIEFLADDPGFQPHHLPYIKNLGTLGIDATLRVVDAVQYRARVDEFDFDMTSLRFAMSSTPGDGLRTMFSSESATTKGSRNLAGIVDPVTDALVDKIIAAETRAELTIACRALDRVFRAGRYWVSHWYKPSYWFAYWDVFARPATKPRYGRGVPDTWWYDRDKAAKIERG